MNKLVEQLKQNNQDFEYYPATPQMLDVVCQDVRIRLQYRYNKVLDIGAGSCGFRKHLAKTLRENDSGFQYYAIEKSQILINNFADDVIVLGTDFNETSLIDKDINIVFCNPPYSEFKQWTSKILKETTAKYVYMIIPQRWKEDESLMNFVNRYYDYEVLGTDDFLNAERQARAKIDIIKFEKKRNEYDPFATFIDDMFDFGFEHRTESMIKEAKKEEIKKELVNAKNKAEMLVDLYNADLNKYMQSLQAVSNIDSELLKEIGINRNSIIESFKQKITGAKQLYWQQVINEMDEITSRLTYKSRNELFNKYQEMRTIDFTFSNIKSTILWVIKNAKKYYDSQLVDIFKRMSDYSNVKKYKSNQRLFDKEKWAYFSNSNFTHYTLDYRIVMDACFLNYYSCCENNLNIHKASEFLSDLTTVANNLGFSIDKSYEEKNKLISSNDKADFGVKYYIYLNNGDQFCEYKIFKNGNCHIKLNTEFTKALNVEASRILGWIKKKEDITKEFDSSLNGAEKYFMANFSNQLTNNNVKLLGN